MQLFYYKCKVLPSRMVIMGYLYWSNGLNNFLAARGIYFNYSYGYSIGSFLYPSNLKLSILSSIFGIGGNYSLNKNKF